MRARLVTRTVLTHNVVFKAFDLEKMELVVMELSFGVDTLIENNDKGLATINAKLTTEGINAKAVMIDSITDKETLYGMLESEFIRLAKVLPPRTKEETEE